MAADYVYELMAKIGLDDDEFNKKLTGAGTTLKDWGGKAGKLVATGAKVIGAGIAAGAAGVVALTKSAVDNYAAYEQLVGGVETLFGKSADTVLEYANNAYKTAGLSANQYMETVTSFSASLLQSLGGDTEAAAQYADKAITDMSDNANKMGSSMESIQTAYQGFAKQNYTMLDNLKLGYGGTKTEMERLVADAEKLDSSFKAQRDENGDLALSYADIVDAIHIVQTEMGITGTTAKEASTTISGSISSMKAAWTNLITGLANGDADLEKLVDDLVNTIIGENGEGGVLNNILPAVERAMDGIMRVVTTAAPKIVPKIVDIIVKNLPMIISAGTKILVALITGIAQALPQLVEAIPEIFTAIVTAFQENWPAMKEAGYQLLVTVGQGILDALNWLIDVLLENGTAAFQTMYDKTTEWLNNIKTNIVNKWNEIKTKIGEALTKIKDTLYEAWDNIKTGVAEKIDNLRQSLVDKFWEIWGELSGIVDWIKGLFDFEWNLPEIHLPQIFGGGGSGYPGGIQQQEYASAYGNPVMFTKPTVLATGSGLKKFGDRGGAELVYGHANLMQDISNAVGAASQPNVIINVYAAEGMSEEQLARKIEKRYVAAAKQRRLMNA